MKQRPRKNNTLTDDKGLTRLTKQYLSKIIVKENQDDTIRTVKEPDAS
jgi:hypothetical protein